MNQQTDEQRTADDKIARLRKRARRLADSDSKMIDVANLLLGILDLLDDEL